MLKWQVDLLGERINTWLGSLLLCSVALWAGVTIWEAATGNNPVVHALERTIQERTELLN